MTTHSLDDRKKFESIVRERCPDAGRGLQISEVPQFGGEHEGETLLRAYSPQKPVIFCMARVGPDGPELLTLKRDGVETVT